MREMMIYDVGHLDRAGYLNRLRFTKPFSKARAFKENGPMDRAVIERIIRNTNFGLALRVGSGLLVVDKDGPNQGPFAELTSPWIATASRGEHLFFRTDIEKGTNKIKFNGLEVDILCNDNTIICIPPSEMITGMIRRWKNGIHHIADLPLFPSALLKRGEPKPMPKMPLLITDDKKIEGMRKWIRKIYAIEGQGGDHQTWRVAKKIASVIRDFKQAMAEILAWDREGFSQPPWSETQQGMKALEWKIQCALKRVTP